MTREIRELKFVSMALQYISGSVPTAGVAPIGNLDIYRAVMPHLIVERIPHRLVVAWWHGNQRFPRIGHPRPDVFSHHFHEMFEELKEQPCPFCAGMEIYLEVHGVLLFSGGFVDMTTMHADPMHRSYAEPTDDFLEFLDEKIKVISEKGDHIYDWEVRWDAKLLAEEVFLAFPDYPESAPDYFLPFQTPEPSARTQANINKRHKPESIEDILRGVLGENAQIITIKGQGPEEEPIPPEQPNAPAGTDFVSIFEVDRNREEEEPPTK